MNQVKNLIKSQIQKTPLHDVIMWEIFAILKLKKKPFRQNEVNWCQSWHHPHLLTAFSDFFEVMFFSFSRARTGCLFKIMTWTKHWKQHFMPFFFFFFSVVIFASFTLLFIFGVWEKKVIHLCGFLPHDEASKHCWIMFCVWNNVRYRAWARWLSTCQTSKHL